ncbi:hypothetical protein BDV97DRAFT_345492 [Delphinella strobiligena]|nr:hypothetical protein BDV97DRAFT_345492 [Delphinella strobiligena]
MGFTRSFMYYLSLSLFCYRFWTRIWLIMTQRYDGQFVYRHAVLSTRERSGHVSVLSAERRAGYVITLLCIMTLVGAAAG